MNLHYVAMCASLAGRKSVKVGCYQNQPKISTQQFDEVKEKLIMIDPDLKISRQQVQVLLSDDQPLIHFTPVAQKAIISFLCRSDVRKLCARIEPTFDFQSEAKLQLDVYLKTVMQKFMQICLHLLELSKTKTLSEKVCEFATKLLLHGDMGEPASNYAQQALDIYELDQGEKGKSRSNKSSLMLSVSKVKLSMDKCCKRVSDTAAVFTTGLMEYIVLDLATSCAENTGNTIASKALMDMIIYNDTEMSTLFRQQPF